MLDWLDAAVRYAESWLDYQMRATELPGCVLAVVAGGALVRERAFGVADLETAEALTPRHRFRVASHSKTFTAAGIFRLHEAGKLHLDGPEIPAAVKVFECEATWKRCRGVSASPVSRSATPNARSRTRAPLPATARTRPGSSVARI